MARWWGRAKAPRSGLAVHDSMANGSRVVNHAGDVAPYEASATAQQVVVLLAAGRYEEAVQLLEVTVGDVDRSLEDRLMDSRLLRRVLEQCRLEPAALRRADLEWVLVDEVEDRFLAMSAQQSLAACYLRHGLARDALELVDDLRYEFERSITVTPLGNVFDPSLDIAMYPVAFALRRKSYGTMLRALLQVKDYRGAVALTQECAGHPIIATDFPFLAKLQAHLAFGLPGDDPDTVATRELCTTALLVACSELEHHLPDEGFHHLADLPWRFGRSFETASTMVDPSWSFDANLENRRLLERISTGRLLCEYVGTSVAHLPQSDPVEQRLGVAWPWYEDELLFLP